MYDHVRARKSGPRCFFSHIPSTLSIPSGNAEVPCVECHAWDQCGCVRFLPRCGVFPRVCSPNPFAFPYPIKVPKDRAVGALRHRLPSPPRAAHSAHGPTGAFPPSLFKPFVWWHGFHLFSPISRLQRPPIGVLFSIVGFLGIISLILIMSSNKTDLLLKIPHTK